MQDTLQKVAESNAEDAFNKMSGQKQKQAHSITQDDVWNLVSLLNRRNAVQNYHESMYWLLGALPNVCAFMSCKY